MQLREATQHAGHRDCARSMVTFVAQKDGSGDEGMHMTIIFRNYSCHDSHDPDGADSTWQLQR